MSLVVVVAVVTVVSLHSWPSSSSSSTRGNCCRRYLRREDAAAFVVMWPQLLLPPSLRRSLRVWGAVVTVVSRTEIRGRRCHRLPRVAVVVVYIRRESVALSSLGGRSCCRLRYDGVGRGAIPAAVETMRGDGAAAVALGGSGGLC